MKRNDVRIQDDIHLGDPSDGGRVFGMISRNLKMTTSVRQRVLRAFCCAWYSIIDKALLPPKETYWKLSSSAHAVSTASPSTTTETAIKNSFERSDVSSCFLIKLLWHVTFGTADALIPMEAYFQKNPFSEHFVALKQIVNKLLWKLIFCDSWK